MDNRGFKSRKQANKFGKRKEFDRDRKAAQPYDRKADKKQWRKAS